MRALTRKARTLRMEHRMLTIDAIIQKIPTQSWPDGLGSTGLTMHTVAIASSKIYRKWTQLSLYFVGSKPIVVAKL
jgi:hypothetical protein